MAESKLDSQPVERNPDELPFVAPCRQLALSHPIKWFRLGWKDFRKAPVPSLTYGGFLLAISYIVAYFTWQLGGYILLLSILSGFVFIAPALALGLYSISCQLERGLIPEIGYCIREGRRNIGNEAVFSMILLIIFLLWARAASMVHVFFPVRANPELADLALFLGIGSMVGSIFAGLVFCASAFSLPMMLDRQVDTVTAVITSVNAVLRNKGPMLVWAGIIVLSLAVSFATAFLGLALLMPILGYGTWHAYKDTIEPDAWEEQRKLPLD